MQDRYFESSPFSIDIIICTYNNVDLLSSTLQSLENQVIKTPVSWQITVVDNNCTDNTHRFVQDLKERTILPIEIIREFRQGLTAARLCGVRNTKKDWLAFIDDDCILAQDWLEQTVLFATNHKNCGAFGGKITLHWEVVPPDYIHRFLYAFAGKNHGSTPFKRKWLAGLGMTLRRQALIETGWIQGPLLDDRIGNKLVSGGDMEIGLRVSALYDVWYNPACRITHIIPKRRTSRIYLRQLLFGLGASRHNVAALTWKKSYLLFLVYAIPVSAGFFLKGIIEGTLELFSLKKKAGYAVFFSSGLGWLSACWKMFWMSRRKKTKLLGGIYRPLFHQHMRVV